MPATPHLLKFGESGWVRLFWTEHDDFRVLARTEQRDGRYVVTNLIARSARQVDAATMKSIPIGWLEGLLNSAGVMSEADVGTNDRLDVALTEVELLIDEMTAKPAEGVLASSGPQRQPLERPDGSDPELFYRQVAEAYQDILKHTSKIAPKLAEEAGVPVATARRWVQEARRRGYLSAARKGRAG